MSVSGDLTCPLATHIQPFDEKLSQGAAIRILVTGNLRKWLLVGGHGQEIQKDRPLAILISECLMTCTSSHEAQTKKAFQMSCRCYTEIEEEEVEEGFRRSSSSLEHVSGECCLKHNEGTCWVSPCLEDKCVALTATSLRCAGAPCHE